MPISPEEMKNAIKETVRVNGFHNAHIKPIVTRGNAWNLGIDPNNATTPNIIILVRPTGESLDAMYGEAAKGLRVIVSNVRKLPSSCIDPRVKSLTYLINTLARAEAQACGADDAIMLDMQGFVSEGSAMNLFLVREGELLTPPVYLGLEGITRNTVISLAREVSIRIREEFLLPYDLYMCDEIFMTGSGSGIVPISEVDRISIGGGEVPGPVTQKIIGLYLEAILQGDPID
jgi:branched-chain amino acid aminotransferase